MIPIPANEIIRNPNTNEENRESPYIDVFKNPNHNLPFYSEITVPGSFIPFSQLIKKANLSSQFTLSDPHKPLNSEKNQTTKRSLATSKCTSYYT